MLINSDEVANYVGNLLIQHSKEFFMDLPSQEELADIADVTIEGSVLTVTITDVAKTQTQKFAITVRG